MSRIPPHEARMIGAWPASQHRNGSPRREPHAAHTVPHGMARLGRAVHLVRPTRTNPAHPPPLIE